MNKKAIVFTFIVIALLSIILIAFLLNVANKNTQAKIQDTNIRVETINTFTKTLNEQLLTKALSSSSNRVILAWLQHLDETNIGIKTNVTGKFINTNNLNKALKDALINANYVDDSTGTVYYLNHMAEPENQENYTLTSLFKEIETLSANSGINFKYGNLDGFNFTIGPNLVGLDAWNLNVTMTIPNYNISDTSGEIFWDFKNKNISIKLNVSNYREPFMLVFNDRNVTMNRTAITDFSNYNNFKSFYLKPEYRQHVGAPSFLSRLQGKFAFDFAGIETILEPNPSYFPNPIPPNTKGYSNIDHLYWQRMVFGCPVDDPNNPGNYIPNLYLDGLIPGSAHMYYYGRTYNNNLFPYCPP